MYKYSQDPQRHVEVIKPISDHTGIRQLPKRPFEGETALMSLLCICMCSLAYHQRMC